MNYIRLIPQTNRFEYIDARFLDMYADKDTFILLSEEDNELCNLHPLRELTYENGKVIHTPPQIDHDALKKARQAQVWEAIKQKRFDNTRGGVYISSVDKWFHNDDPSRTQYLALQVLPNHPEKLMWKTMDNSFVHMTKDLLYEIASTMLTEEQQDFANAERHRLAMLESDNPLEYDFSDGWSAIYEPE